MDGWLQGQKFREVIIKHGMDFFYPADHEPDMKAVTDGRDKLLQAASQLVLVQYTPLPRLAFNASVASACLRQILSDQALSDAI